MNKSLDYRKLNAACRLLLDLGSDQEFEQYLRILRDSKVHDIGRYRQLWQVASEGKSQHIVRILAVLLDDERLASPKDSVRYCDFAGALLRKFSEEKFGFEQWDRMSLPERYTAVLRARAWMKEARHGAR